jgi:hypothetical protein
MRRGFLNTDYDMEADIFHQFRLSIDYDGERESEIIKFDSGDPVVDYIDFLFWYDSQDDVFMVGYSSDWDHFFMDTEKWRQIYVDHEQDGSPVIKNFNNLSLMNLDKLSKYVVNKDISTFQELKDYYFSKRPEKKKELEQQKEAEKNETN